MTAAKELLEANTDVAAPVVETLAMDLTKLELHQDEENKEFALREAAKIAGIGTRSSPPRKKQKGKAAAAAAASAD